MDFHQVPVGNQTGKDTVGCRGRHAAQCPDIGVADAVVALEIVLSENRSMCINLYKNAVLYSEYRLRLFAID